MKARKKRPHNLLVAEVSIHPDDNGQGVSFFRLWRGQVTESTSSSLIFYYYQLKNIVFVSV